MGDALKGSTAASVSLVQNARIVIIAGALSCCLAGCDALPSRLPWGDQEAGEDGACRSRPVLPVRLPGGSFDMGSTAVYREEGPVRKVAVEPFWIDAHEVTNARFEAFVLATKYVTVAEQPVDPAGFGMERSAIPPELLKPGSLVFVPPKNPPRDFRDWWMYVPGAHWRRPLGPDGPIAEPNDPVVHLAARDMMAFARWAGGRLPSEAEWEYAAASVSSEDIGQPVQANSWQGVFPMVDDAKDGFAGIAPVGCFEPNRFGLFDMVGNVWEVTADVYEPLHQPNGSARRWKQPEALVSMPDTDMLVMKGGSYLCAPNYCQRYRAAARSPRDPGLGASNVGFRLVYDRLPEAAGTKARQVQE